MSFLPPDPMAPPVDPVTGLPLGPAPGAPIPMPPGDPLADPTAMGDPMLGDPLAAAETLEPDPMAMLPMDPNIDPATGMPLPPPPTAAQMGPQLPDQTPGMGEFFQTLVPQNIKDPDGQKDPVAEALGLVEVGPANLPDWWRPVKKPKPTEIMARAERARTDNDLRVAMAQEMTQWLNHERIGMFPGDEKDIETGEIVQIVLSALRDEHDTAKTNIGRMDTYMRMMYRDANLRDEVAAVEDWAYYLQECEDRQYLNAYGSLLAYDMPDMLMRNGMLVGVDVLDPTNRHCGLYMDTLDPASCFPEFEGSRGLSAMWRVYDDSAGNVLGNYGDPAGKLEKKLRKLVPAATKGEYDPYQYITVTEHWDREWVSILVAGEEILTRRHLLGRVPFTVMYGAWGQPANTVSGTGRTNMVFSDWGQLHINDRARDLARVAQPFLYRRLLPHSIEEAAAGYAVTQIRNALFPMMIHAYDPMNAMESKPRLRHGRKVVNRVPLPDTLEVVANVPDPTTANTVGNIFAQNRMTGMAPAAQQGQAAPQTSGAALDAMIDQGSGRHIEVAARIEAFRRMRTEWRLEITRDWLPLIGDTSENRAGVMLVPNRRTYGRYANPVHKLTREMLERTGTQVKVTLRRWRPDPMAAQYFATLRSARLVSEFEAISKLDIVTDPTQEQERMEDEEMHMVPEIAQQRGLMRLEKLIDEAVDQDDYDSADYHMVAAMVIQKKIQQQMLADNAAAAMAGITPGLAMGAMVGGTPGVNSNPSLVMQNQGKGPTPKMVHDVGHNGGRPAGTSASGGPAQLPGGGNAGAI